MDVPLEKTRATEDAIWRGREFHNENVGQGNLYFVGVGEPNKSKLMSLLPGQPVSARPPLPLLGPGVYERAGVVRASLLGTPSIEGTVRLENFTFSAR